jgi:hypothetical protein
MNIDCPDSRADSHSMRADQYWSREDHWPGLEGAFVELRRSDGSIVDSGCVEAVTTDGSIMWMSLDGASPRRLHQRLPWIEIWVLRESVLTAPKTSNC